jgi:hypothetical protein
VFFTLEVNDYCEFKVHDVENESFEQLESASALSTTASLGAVVRSGVADGNCAVTLLVNPSKLLLRTGMMTFGPSADECCRDPLRCCTLTRLDRLLSLSLNAVAFIMSLTCPSFNLRALSTLLYTTKWTPLYTYPRNNYL